MAESAWTRRQFVGGGAAALGAFVHLEAAGAQEGIPPPVSQSGSPEIVAGGLVPLLESNLARPMRYQPEGGGFVIRNGREFFNRPLYGPNIPFRVDGGDLPEFSLYLPGHGGNLRLGLARAGHPAIWMHEAKSIETRYVEGRLDYRIGDSSFGGVVELSVSVQGTMLVVGVKADSVPQDASLLWAFAGVSGRKGRRNGDIGCESEPVSRFFRVRPEECRGNVWTLQKDAARVIAGKIQLAVQTEAGAAASWRVVDGNQWDRGWDALWASKAGAEPAIAGRMPLKQGHLLCVAVLEGAVLAPAEAKFPQRGEQLRKIAATLCWKTPDEHLDGVAGALGIAADAVWDEAQSCVMHGAVAWRIALAGWRGPYALDVTGRHDRMQRHLRHWMAKQNVSDVANGSGGTAAGIKGFQDIVAATGAPDKGSQNARSEGLLHSNGDVSKNHYDMNLVLFDALLRHLRWTGDAAFAREAWPALVRHAAWERRLFRREYGTPDATSPLYEAYAAIWASDNLQYNGGGAAHSSAYNVFLNREMAVMAALLGEPAEVIGAYRAEADAICAAMRKHLWMPEKGAYAESCDWLGGRELAEDPAVWTVYHVIDCEMASPREAWQMAADRLRAIRRVPVVGEGVPPRGWQMACSDWLPYTWSLTLLTLGENLHMALALYQAGLAEEGYGLLRGSLIDACYRGLCPGNFPMSLQMDPHRQESQRDFADPIGCASRAVVEGLWGVRPNLPMGLLVLRPQLPPEWEHAELVHPSLTLRYKRAGNTERWTVESRFAKPVKLRLELPARTVELPGVMVNGAVLTAAFDREAVGRPVVVLELTAAAKWEIELSWHGAAPVAARAAVVCAIGEVVAWPAGVSVETIEDVAGCVQNGKAAKTGGFTVFARMQHGDCVYWLPIELKIREAAKPALARVRELSEPVDLGTHLDGQVREILTRPHAAPRSRLVSLNLPDGLLGGWANFDDTAAIDDAGLRRAGGLLRVVEGLVFRTPAEGPNCCFLSHWAGDRRSVELPLTGWAASVSLLLACATFPQATRSLHGLVRVRYADGGVAETELRSPANWWPVEQDYLVDDYIFRLEPHGEPEIPLPVRVDLRSGAVRVLTRAGLKGRGGRVPGGSATVLRVPLDPVRALASLELRCERYGVVMGVLAATLGRVFG